MANDLKLGLSLDLKTLFGNVQEASRSVKTLFDSAKKDGEQIFDGAKKSAQAFGTQMQELQGGIGQFASKIKDLFSEAGAQAGREVGIATRFKREFGDSAASADEFSKGLSASLARSKPEIEDYLTKISFVTRNMGFAKDAGLALSKQLVAAGYDFAAAHGLETADAMNVLQSALAGNVRVLKQYGLANIDTAEKEEALRRGLNPDALNAQETAEVRLTVVTNALAEAKGAAAQSAKGLGGAYRTLQNETDALKAEVGKLWNEAIAPFVKQAAAAIKAVREWTEAHPALAKAMGAIVVASGLLLTGIVALVKTVTAVQAFSKAFVVSMDAMKVAANSTAEGATSLIASLGKLGPVAAVIGVAVASWKIGDELAQWELLNPAIRVLDDQIKEVQRSSHSLSDGFYANRKAMAAAAEEADVFGHAMQALADNQETLRKAIEDSGKNLFSEKFGSTEASVAGIREAFKARKVEFVKGYESEMKIISEWQHSLSVLKNSKDPEEQQHYKEIEAKLKGHLDNLKKIQDASISDNEAINLQIQKIEEKRTEELQAEAEKRIAAVHKEREGLIKEYDDEIAQIKSRLDKLTQLDKEAADAARSFHEDVERTLLRSRNAKLADISATIEQAQAVLAKGQTEKDANQTSEDAIRLAKLQLDAGKELDAQLIEQRDAAEKRRVQLVAEQKEIGREADRNGFMRGQENHGTPEANAALEQLHRVQAETQRALEERTAAETQLGTLRQKNYEADIGFENQKDALEKSRVASIEAQKNRGDEEKQQADNLKTTMEERAVVVADELSKVVAITAETAKLIAQANERITSEKTITELLQKQLEIETQMAALKNAKAEAKANPGVDKSHWDNSEPNDAQMEQAKKFWADRDAAKGGAAGVQSGGDENKVSDLVPALLKQLSEFANAYKNAVPANAIPSAGNGASPNPAANNNDAATASAQNDFNAALKDYGETADAKLSGAQAALASNAQMLRSLTTKMRGYDMDAAGRVDLAATGLSNV